MGQISKKLQSIKPDEHPAKIEIELAGETFPWFIGRRTFDLVNDHNDEVDFEEILGDAMDGRISEMDSAEERFNAIGRLVWAGFLPFEEDLEFEDVTNVLTFHDIATVFKPIRAHFQKLQDEVEQLEKESEELGGDDSGKSLDSEVIEKGSV